MHYFFLELYSVFQLKNFPILRTKSVDSTVCGGDDAFVTFKAVLLIKNGL